MRQRDIIESFNCAFEGLIYVLRTQRHMRLHVLIGTFAFLLGVYFGFSKLELVVLCTVITVVLITEMINTAAEHIVDIISTSFHPLARIVKDISAGAVLLSSVAAIIIGYLMFLERVAFTMERGIWRIRQSPWHITFIALIIVFLLVLFGKIFFHKGTPLRGGMPSGHAAVAFSMWTIVAFLSKNALVTTITLIMAMLIARGRLKNKIHTVWEVLVGSILGIVVTTLVFQILQQL